MWTIDRGYRRSRRSESGARPGRCGLMPRPGQGNGIRLAAGHTPPWLDGAGRCPPYKLAQPTSVAARPPAPSRAPGLDKLKRQVKGTARGICARSCSFGDSCSFHGGVLRDCSMSFRFLSPYQRPTFFRGRDDPLLALLANAPLQAMRRCCRIRLEVSLNGSPPPLLS